METFLLSGTEDDDFFKIISKNSELLCKTALNFDDFELVRFIKKYGGSPWFFHTGQAHKGVLYTISSMDNNESSYRIRSCKNVLALDIPLGMSPKYIKHLIENGADVNEKDDEGQGPLIQACVCCNYDTVKILLDAGADPTHRITENESALHVAFKYNTDEVFFLIYDAIFQRKPSESELLQHFTCMPPMIQNIIKQTQGDRMMLKLTQRLYNFMDGNCHMNARELGYILEKLAKYDHMDEIAANLLEIGNDRNDSEIVHVVLRKLYRLKHMEIILQGQMHAIYGICRPNILNLYLSYILRHDDAYK